MLKPDIERMELKAKTHLREGGRSRRKGNHICVKVDGMELRWNDENVDSFTVNQKVLLN